MMAQTRSPCVENGGERTTSAEGGSDTGETVRFHISWKARAATEVFDTRARVDASRAESHRPVCGSAPSPAVPTREKMERTARGLRSTAAANRLSRETRKRTAATASEYNASESNHVLMGHSHV